jgi:hypothetical protein
MFPETSALLKFFVMKSQNFLWVVRSEVTFKNGDRSSNAGGITAACLLFQQFASDDDFHRLHDKESLSFFPAA